MMETEHAPPAKPLSFSIHSFGCKVNTYDSGLIEQRFKSAGFNLKVGFDLNDQKPTGSPLSKVHILNTCAVTAEATKEAIRRVRRIKARDPLSLIVVTGCAAQVDTDQLSNLPGVDLVVANSHKADLVDLVRRHYAGDLKQKVFKSNIFKKEDLEAGGGLESRHTRSFLKIQDGCNSFCTFCVIPFARGKSRSIPVKELVARIAELVSSGVQEVVLTGVHIGDYWDETEGRGLALEDLVEAVLLQTQIPRLRLSSLEPIEISPRLLNLFQDPRLCPHFHMSIQSADSEVLKGMKRNYGYREVESSLERIATQVPGAFVGMDVIAGFPGETAKQFANTFDCLSSVPWTKIHVFPYSARPGTFAARNPEAMIPPGELKLRAEKLRALSQERYSQQALRQVGLMKKVLLLRGGRQGLSRDYWQVSLGGAPPSVSSAEIEVRIQGFDPSNRGRMDNPLIGAHV